MRKLIRACLILTTWAMIISIPSYLLSRYSNFAITISTFRISFSISLFNLFCNICISACINCDTNFLADTILDNYK